ncbi:DUF1311 domain-containing protein [Atlantibacter sp. RC6]|uniref:DUF1311 domain-containing protein n=1 Tax=Atlantibacter sp. RC6 TaxID=2587036 RepID=UPI0016062A7F|nr:DUF1311 domain-containing protein [Atlantibacter sp. RC6]MBB3320657.1 hypothetical protein [Atlantibacter sp. RC6]
MKVTKTFLPLLFLCSSAHAVTFNEITFSPQEMKTAFQKNELRADKKFDCSYIVKGVLNEVYRNPMSENTYQIRLRGGVNIYFEDLDQKPNIAKDIADLEIGDEVYVLAYKAHYSLGDVWGDKGYAVKKNLDVNKKIEDDLKICINENVKSVQMSESVTEKNNISIDKKSSNEDQSSDSMQSKKLSVDDAVYYSMADKKLNVIWSSLTKEQKDKILPDQRQWIKNKEKCADMFCKTEHTIDRIIELTKYAESSR